MNPLSKNIFDRVFSFTCLLLLLPFMVIIGLAVGLTSRGPVIFRQLRTGRNGTRFNIVKFRTMVHSSSRNTISVKGDPRITPVGRFLRKWKLDELPELWNILTGDMSFVGPRPNVPGYEEKLSCDEKRILLLRPGITGPATLKYIDEEEILAGMKDPVKYTIEVIYPDKVRINLNYLDNWSFWLDLKIMFYTLLRKKLEE